jgi:hypothetical protein
VDKSAHTGAQVVKVDYLDSSYGEKMEIIVLNGTTVIPTINTNYFRINSFRMIFGGTPTGLTERSVGSISIRNLADTPIYSYMLAGFTRARNSAYTVPAGKTLWITQLDLSFGITGNGKVEYARLFARANREPATNFLTGNLFYPYSEIVTTNAEAAIHLDIPTKLIQYTDIKVSGIATAAGIATSVLRGYLTTP